jgi:hypothetical protein
LKLIGTRSNRDGIGARITIKAGKRTWVDEVRSGSSYNSSSDMRVHFGLGNFTKIDSLQVRWPSGQVESFDKITIDSINKLTESERAGTNAAVAKTGR